MTRPLRPPRAAFTMAAIEASGTTIVRPTREDLARWREVVRPVLDAGETENTMVLTHGMAVVVDRLCERVEELEATIRRALDVGRDCGGGHVEAREILLASGSYEAKP